MFSRGRLKKLDHSFGVARVPAEGSRCKEASLPRRGHCGWPDQGDLNDDGDDDVGSTPHPHHSPNLNNHQLSMMGWKSQECHGAVCECIALLSTVKEWRSTLIRFKAVSGIVAICDQTPHVALLYRCSDGFPRAMSMRSHACATCMLITYFLIALAHATNHTSSIST